MRFFPFINVLIVSFSTVALLTGCGGGKDGGSADSGASSDGEEFVVAVAAPFTGDSSEFGAQMRLGAELFEEELNSAGGINGRKLKLIYEDDAGKAEQAQTVATTLASDDSVLAVIGHFNSSCSLAGKGIYTQAGLVMFSPASTNVEVTKDTDYAFRNIFTDDFQGQSLATYSSQVLGKKNAAILFDNDDYGTGLKESFKERASELGLNVVTELAYNRDAPDFRSQLTTIQGTQPQPDIILVAGLYTQAANIARQARDMGIQTQLIGGDGVFSTQFINLAGDAAEGAIISCPFLLELGGEKAAKFAAAFKERNNREPDAWSALSYDALSMVCEGLKKNGFTRDAVLKYLQSVNSPETAYDGVVGKTYFDEEGDTKRPVQMAQVKNGKFVAADKQLTEGLSAEAKASEAAAPEKPQAAAEARVEDAKTTSAAEAAPAVTPQATPATTPADAPTTPAA